ncbi:MAG: hypothetical protein LBB50_05620 [Oscillospiraceae bacterium]|jgi:pimeloyl-ACP methyl ester carboxylesterase|nr:hypothetical protein [Oscillospiraceae bacterium]
MKYFRKSTALLLSVVLLVSALGIGFRASAGNRCSCAEIPRVMVDGIGVALHYDQGGPDEYDVSVVAPENLKEQVLPIVTNIIAAAATRSWDKGADAISALAYGLFGHLQVDEYGVSVNPVTNFAKPVNTQQNHQTNPKYEFSYDWRMDPMESAALLNQYIQEVKSATGHSQVNLIAFSEGSMVCMGYFAQFQYDDIAQYISIMGAHNGLTLVGELFNKHIDLNGTIAAEYMRAYGRFAGDDGAFALFKPLADVLEGVGLVDALVGALNLLLKNVQDKVFADTLIPLFVQWPALWGFVPHEYYESAKQTLLSGPKYDDFRALIDNFHYKAGPGYKADTLLANAAKKTKVSIVASYGFPTQPFAPNSLIDADGLIDTARESCGATTAGLFKTFPQGYTQKVADEHNHVSPDLRVDASTCLLPEQTWFLKNQIHFTFGFAPFLDFLVSSKNQPTVWADPAYPQFLTHLPNNTFVPTQPEAPAKTVSLPQSFLALFDVVCQLIIAKVQEG